MPVTVARLFYYPVKSLAGVEAPALEVGAHGPAWDREWMLVDGRGAFLSQRTFPRLCLLRPALEERALRLELPGTGPLRAPLSVDGHPRRRVTLWDEPAEALDEGDGPAETLSRFLGAPCRLVRRLPGARGFPDDAPVLLAGEESLADLNARLAAPLPMERFRPNVVVRGAAAYAEDSWTALAAGGLRLRVSHPCPRCAITTVDPATGETGPEPLRTLAAYRRARGQVLFGVYCAPQGSGTLRAGQAVVPA